MLISIVKHFDKEKMTKCSHFYIFEYKHVHDAYCDRACH